jgi:hypothetical protein
VGRAEEELGQSSTLERNTRFEAFESLHNIIMGQCITVMDDILEAERCMRLSIAVGQGNRLSNPSIDRRDSPHSRLKRD